jgi:hypothetical protein
MARLGIIFTQKEEHPKKNPDDNKDENAHQIK